MQKKGCFDPRDYSRDDRFVQAIVASQKDMSVENTRNCKIAGSCMLTCVGVATIRSTRSLLAQAFLPISKPTCRYCKCLHSVWSTKVIAKESHILAYLSIDQASKEAIKMAVEGLVRLTCRRHPWVHHRVSGMLHT